MGFLAFGILLLLVGATLALADLLPPGPLVDPLVYVGWGLIGLGSILATAHVAVGPRARRRAGRDRAER